MTTIQTCTGTTCDIIKTVDAGCCPVPSTVQSHSMSRLEKLCRVSLGVFALAVNTARGMAAGGAGVAFGLGTHVYSLITQGSLPAQGYRRPVCAQGYMETLSGRAFSPGTNLVVTAVFIGVHILHYPPFFVPFTTFCVGMWLGGAAVRLGWERLHAPGQLGTPAHA